MIILRKERKESMRVRSKRSKNLAGSLQKILLKICQEIEGVLAEINGMERRVREGRGVSRKKGERVRVSERDEIEREKERERKTERERESERDR